jgi:O-antigen/teichoic acid export membrane protein
MRIVSKALAGATVPDAPAGNFGERILACGSIYGLTNFGVKGLSFLLIPVISRFISPAGYGVVALAETIAGPIGMVCGLGTATSLRRIYFDYVDDPGQSRSYIGSAFRFVILTTMVGVALSWYVGPHALRLLAGNCAVPFFPLFAVAICSAGLGQVQQTQLSLFQVQNRPWAYSALSFLSFALGTVSTCWLVIWSGMGALGIITSRFLSVIAAVVIALWMTRGWFTTAWNWRALRQQVRLGFPLMLFDVVNVALVFADRLILQHYRPLNDVGIYSIAYTFGALMLTLTVSLSQAWEPFFFESARQGKIAELRNLSSVLVVGLAGIASIGAMTSGPVMHLILDRRYAAAAPLVPIILAAYLLNSFYYLLGVVAMQHKRSGTIAVVTTIACAVNIGLNFWWVPRWGSWGAAFATVAAYFLQAALMYAALRTQAGAFYNYLSILGSIGIFTAAVVIAEVPWPPAVRPFAVIAGLVTALALFWPLGLNRVFRVLRAELG